MPGRITKEKIIELENLFEGCLTYLELGKRWGVTKESSWSKVRRYGLLEKWNDHVKAMKEERGLLNIKAVYALYFAQSPKKKYIGSTVNFRKRLNNHLSYLKRSKHKVKSLQKDFNEYGIKSLKFEIIKRVNSASELLPEERKWFDSTKRKYNKAAPILTEEERIIRTKESIENLKKERRKLPTINRRHKYVYWNKIAQLWVVPVIHNKKIFNLGCFKKEEDAVKARNKFLKERGLLGKLDQLCSQPLSRMSQKVLDDNGAGLQTRKSIRSIKFRHTHP